MISPLFLKCRWWGLAHSISGFLFVPGSSRDGACQTHTKGVVSMAVIRNMVGTPLTPQFLEITMRGTCSSATNFGKTIVNVFHFNQLAMVPIAEDLESLIQNFKSEMQPTIGALLSADYVGAKFFGRFMDDPTSAVNQNVTGIDGTTSGDRLPTYAAAVVQLKSDNRGRSYRGSKHFTPIAESDSDDDILTNGGLTKLQNVANKLAFPLQLTGTNGSVWQLVILSPTLSNLTANPSVFTFSTISSAVANSQLGTMRRRKVKPNA